MASLPCKLPFNLSIPNFMTPDPTGIESRLRSLQWQPAPPGALDAALRAALEASVPEKRSWLRSVPLPVRWGLAACWALSLGFRLATPAPVPGPASAGGGAPGGGFIAYSTNNDQIYALQRELASVRQ